MTFFQPDLASPESWLEVMISSLLCCFFGLMMFIGAIRYEDNYGKPATWWRWCFLPLALGLLFGIQKMWFLTDYIYGPTAFSRKLRIAHYLSFVIPLFSIAFVALWKRKASSRNEKSIYAGLS
jgi:hypothetical protein